MFLVGGIKYKMVSIPDYSPDLNSESEGFWEIASNLGMRVINFLTIFIENFKDQIRSN